MLPVLKIVVLQGFHAIECKKTVKNCGFLEFFALQQDKHNYMIE